MSGVVTVNGSPPGGPIGTLGFAGTTCTSAASELSGRDVSIQVPIRRVALAVTLDGASPFYDNRGSTVWQFTEADPAPGAEPYACEVTRWQTFDPLRIETWLPPGRWRVVGRHACTCCSGTTGMT